MNEIMKALDRHIDIVEEQLFDAQVQLKKLREDLSEVNQETIGEIQ